MLYVIIDKIVITVGGGNCFTRNDGYKAFWIHPRSENKDKTYRRVKKIFLAGFGRKPAKKVILFFYLAGFFPLMFVDYYCLYYCWTVTPERSKSLVAAKKWTIRTFTKSAALINSKNFIRVFRFCFAISGCECDLFFSTFVLFTKFKIKRLCAMEWRAREKKGDYRWLRICDYVTEK